MGESSVEVSNGNPPPRKGEPWFPFLPTGPERQVYVGPDPSVPPTTGPCPDPRPELPVSLPHLNCRPCLFTTYGKSTPYILSMYLLYILSIHIRVYSHSHGRGPTSISRIPSVNR